MIALMNLKEFIDNPMGKGSNTIPNRQLVKDDLTRRFNKIKGDIKHTIYQKDNQSYFIHVIIPSESERDNTYDVVIELVPGENNEFIYDNFIKRYIVKFFSNCPSFTYTYAQTFYQYGFLIEPLKKKYRDEVLDNMPVIRNPNQIISYEKSIYFASLFIQDKYYYRSKMAINSEAKPYKATEFKELIRATDTIDMEIKKGNDKVKEKKKRDARAIEEKKPRNNSTRGRAKIAGRIVPKTRSTMTSITKPRPKIKGSKSSK